MLDSIRRERAVRKALEAIARQRVVLILQPGSIPVVERSPPNEEWFDLAIRTCHIRGWVDVLYQSIPSATVQYEGDNPVFPLKMTPKTVYRLTEGGWIVIRRSHHWVIATFVVSVISAIAGITSVIISMKAPDASGIKSPSSVASKSASMTHTR